MERYEIVRDIGAGNFGVARLVRDKWTGELYAVKFIERGEKVTLHLLHLFYSFYFVDYLNCLPTQKVLLFGVADR